MAEPAEVTSLAVTDGTLPILGVQPNAVSAGLIAAAAMASYFPVLRAASVDPVVALRAE